MMMLDFFPFEVCFPRNAFVSYTRVPKEERFAFKLGKARGSTKYTPLRHNGKRRLELSQEIFLQCKVVMANLPTEVESGEVCGLPSYY